MNLCSTCKCCQEHCDCNYEEEEFEENDVLLCPECWCNSTQNPDADAMLEDYYYWLDNDGDPDSDE